MVELEDYNFISYHADGIELFKKAFDEWFDYVTNEYNEITIYVEKESDKTELINIIYEKIDKEKIQFFFDEDSFYFNGIKIKLIDKEVFYMSDINNSSDTILFINCHMNIDALLDKGISKRITLINNHSTSENVVNINITKE